METQIYFRPTDLSTADYLEHRVGRRSAYAHSQTKREGAETSQGLNEQGIPLVTAQAVLQMKDNEILVFHRRLPPFKARRVEWVHYTWLSKRREIAPPQLIPLPQVTLLPMDDPAKSSRAGHDDYIDPELLLNERLETEITRREIN